MTNTYCKYIMVMSKINLHTNLKLLNYLYIFKKLKPVNKLTTFDIYYSPKLKLIFEIQTLIFKFGDFLLIILSTIIKKRDNLYALLF